MPRFTSIVRRTWIVERVKHGRWLVVAALTVLAVAIPLVPNVLPTSAEAMDPARLRELVMRSASVPHQGFAESSGRLPVPELPKLASVTSLLTGTTRIRTWYESPSRERFDVITTTGETDVYRGPDGEQTYDSGENKVTDLYGNLPVRLPRAGDLLPPELARRILSAAPGDQLSSIPAQRVAGISAAGLRLTPADPETTIGHVDVWADPASGVPLRVELTAKGTGNPVLITRFVDFSLERPSDDVLTAKLGPQVGQDFIEASDIAEALGRFGLIAPPTRLAGRDLRIEDLAGIAGVYGTGLSSFVVVQLPRDVANSAFDAATKAGGKQTQTTASLRIAPLSLAVVRSGRRTFLLAGMVSTSVLDQASTELAALRRSPR
jgi:hypothetical protein